MTTLFISDLHLDPSRPAVTRAFFDLLDTEVKQADALYILGDFFEVWVGDDDDAELSRQVIAALRAVTAAGTPVYFMHGNRDFLIGAQFARETGCQLLPDPSIVDLYGKRTLLMHGDLLCIDDQAYMAFRAECRQPAWQQAVLARPLQERRLLAAKLREDSRDSTSNKAEDIMDVNTEEVDRYLREHQVELLIHGHTHRPAIHQISNGTRIVLGDWEQHSWVLRYQSDHQYQLVKQAIPA